MKRQIMETIVSLMMIIMTTSGCGVVTTNQEEITKEVIELEELSKEVDYKHIQFTYDKEMGCFFSSFKNTDASKLAEEMNPETDMKIEISDDYYCWCSGSMGTKPDKELEAFLKSFQIAAYSDYMETPSFRYEIVSRGNPVIIKGSNIEGCERYMVPLMYEDMYVVMMPVRVGTYTKWGSEEWIEDDMETVIKVIEEAAKQF